MHHNACDALACTTRLPLTKEAHDISSRCRRACPVLHAQPTKCHSRDEVRERRCFESEEDEGHFTNFQDKKGESTTPNIPLPSGRYGNHARTFGTSATSPPSKCNMCFAYPANYLAAFAQELHYVDSVDASRSSLPPWNAGIPKAKHPKHQLSTPFDAASPTST